VVRYDAKAGERSLDLLRWGLVPYWAKDLNVGFANFNAKAEGVENRPAFREKDRDPKAALCDRARRQEPDGAGWPVGQLALARGRVGAKLRRQSPPRRMNCARSFTT
jgi:hypothetical protein